MRYQTFDKDVQSTYPVAILSKTLDEKEMRDELIAPGQLDPKHVIAYELITDGKKIPVALQKPYLDDLLSVLHSMGTKYLIVTNGEYFKTLTNSKKAEVMLGYVLPNVYPEGLAGQFQVLYCPPHNQVIHNPGPTRAKIKVALDALYAFTKGLYQEPGKDIIKHAEYPQTLKDIKAALLKLYHMDKDLTADIEGFSLHPHDAGIGTISFAWSQHEGVAFPVDLGPDGQAVREILKEFFIVFDRKLIWHNISYDVTVLIYQLFMTHSRDMEGLLFGLGVMLRNWDDTKLISYLATNSCAGNKLSLKEQALEFAGNYAVEEIKDIRQINLSALLEYNLVDCLSTWYVYHKNFPVLVKDDQQDIYETLFKPAIWDIIQMQLTGMPINMDRVKNVKQEVEIERQNAIDRINNHILVYEFVEKLESRAEYQRYQDWKDRKDAGVKVRPYVPLNKKLEFNPNSPIQLQELFYDVLALPIIERTDSKQPSTSGETLEKLKAYTQDERTKELIDALLDFKAVDKIFSTFIPAMENARKGNDGWHYLHGNFNLGGTVSGRLSSSNPNLQTIPSNGATPAKKRYAKLIKSCFQAPPGWLYMGLDFDSLEDRISALTTKDPNKLKVYTDGFDGHCLRAHSYFGDQMSNNINPNDPESINSIADLYPDLRQQSKMPTFALTYQGTFVTLMAKGGFSEDVAKQIEQRYHELYKVSDQWVDDKLNKATKTGYITGAFGLRVRTPLLAQVVRNTAKTPWEAQAEGRTAGNALGQSWCLLNTRASIEFMRKVRNSSYRLSILPCAHIHDAQYFLVKDDISIVSYLNEHLVKAVEWQDHPDIAHPQVKLGGGLSLFWPSWKDEIKIPNGLFGSDLQNHIAQKLQKDAA